MRSGLLLRKFSPSVLVLLVFVTLASARAAAPPVSQPDVVKLMPKTNAVAGWEIYPQTLVYARGAKLTEIYDGGFELYTKNGVIDAAQQMYRTRSPEIIVTVTIHRMTSIQSAKRFYEYWQKTDSKQPTYKPVKLMNQGFVYTANAATEGYSCRDKYFVTISVSTETGRAAAEDFMRAIDKSIGELVKPKRSGQ